MPDTTTSPTVNAADLLRRLRKNDSLPALDENVLQLCRMTADGQTSTAALTAVIMRDAALTSRLLTVANSAAYRSKTAIKTVSAAVVLLGFERIRQLAVGLSLFHKHTGDIRNKELYRLLVCSYCTGAVAMNLARLIRDPIPEELFVNGLLRQLPRLMLANAFPDAYQKMESRIVHGKLDVNNACEEVFRVRYDDIATSIAEYWSLPETIVGATIGSGIAAEKRRRAVALAVDIADLLFGNRPTGPAAAADVTQRAQDLLDRATFSIPEFAGAVAASDPSLDHFFHLSEQDLVMMARIAEWGKVDSSNVANSLTDSFEKHAPPEASEDAPLMMAHFLSELMLAIRNNADINTVLMIAQEGIYRCIRPECLIAAFVDRERTTLQGRLYAGRRDGMTAGRYKVPLKASDCMAIQNLNDEEAVIGSTRNNQILPDNKLLHDLKLESILLAPIRARDQAIGQFFLGREVDAPPFSADDSLWMTAIAGHVGMSFEHLNGT